MKRSLRLATILAALTLPWVVADSSDVCAVVAVCTLTTSSLCDRRTESCPPCLIHLDNRTTLCLDVDVATRICPSGSQRCAVSLDVQTKKALIGAIVWLVCMILGVLFARHLLSDPGCSHLPQTAMNPRDPSEDKDDVMWIDHFQPLQTKHARSSASSSSPSLPIIPSSVRSLASLTSTTLYVTNGTIIERSSRPADVNVPRYVYRESDVSVATTGATAVRRPTELQDLSEDTCFESMRTRISNLTMLDVRDAVHI
ncbi:Aste57867_1078 [Aphanomyces stellatus]|uniref:Aste57867_1078 protein n=1 Tax=Aphanomyces stellatus TaxID=120398 RepID=A0A485K8F4_9STRA|nr:hypothetical protein As57867_001077 [Aphanomyces stellatus]VFT78300.1 Aste57867_1078 [Aphanomyces stellatus]